MLPEDRNDERNKNGSSPPPNGYNVFEEDDEDLMEIMQSCKKPKEEEDVLEVRVLVVKPGNKQRLLTLDVPLHCDERDILLEVHKLFADRQYYINMYTANIPNLECDYIVEYYENASGKNLHTIIDDYLRANSEIPPHEDSGILDDEVIEISQNEATHISDNEIEEIRADDDVLIEKIILKSDVLDQEKDKSTGTVDISCEEMDLYQSRQIEENVNEIEEDVIPIETSAPLTAEDSEIQEVPALSTDRFASYCEDNKEVEEIRVTMAKCDTEIENASFTEKYFAQINRGVKELADNMNLTRMEEDEKKMEEDKRFDEEVAEVWSEKKMAQDKRFDKGVGEFWTGKEMEQDKRFDKEVRELWSEGEMEQDKRFDKEVGELWSEKEMEEDRPSFEEVTDSEKEVEETVFEEVGENEDEKEREEVKAVSDQEEENESDKEMEEGEKAMEDDVETVCIVDDTLDDDENENSSQTSEDKTILFIYPMSRGGITMTRDDYECLSEYQYLNDIIIDFYLNYLMQEVLSPKDRERTHLFSSHFYTRLTKQTPDEDSVSLSLDERRYAGVQRWTKDVDIFQKDFIIVPINEHSHWFLAIICFPKLVDFVGWGDFEYENEGQELQKPCILIFDSLGGNAKTRVAVTLRGYLRHEYMTKTNEKKDFTCNNLKTVYPKAPCQQNATDCGLYILQYVESFFKDPLLDFTLPLKDLSKWFSSTVIEKKREKIAKLIAKLAIKYNKNKAVHLPMLKLPKPKLTESLSKASHSKKSEISSKTKAKHKVKVQSKKKSQTKRIEHSKRFKHLCDTDSDSDATVPLSLSSRLKLRISSRNPQPLRRSAQVGRTHVSSYYSFDSEDSSPSPTKSTSTVPSSFLKEDVRSNCSSNRTDARKYLGPRVQPSWSEASHTMESKIVKDNQNVSNSWGDHFSDLFRSKKDKEKQDALNTHETTRAILKSGGISTDRFYNLSAYALHNESTIPPDMSFSQYRIKRKNGDSTV